MSKLITILTIALLTGCYGSQFAQMRQDNAELKDQNRRLWAKLEKSRPGERTDKTSTQTPGGSATVGQQVQTGAMAVRQKHGVYMGAVGEVPRQITQGRKLKVTNLICDDNDRDGGLNCRDADQNGEPDYNTWMSFSVVGDGPVICDSGFVHPDMQVSMLLPQQSCYLELGAVRTIKLRIQLYRNNGNPWNYLDLDTTPYKTAYVTVTVGNGIKTMTFDETSL